MSTVQPTVQQNFAASLSASGLSPRRQFTAVKRFVKKAPTMEKIGSYMVEHIELPLELNTYGSRNILIAAKTIDEMGEVCYVIGETVSLKS